MSVFELRAENAADMEGKELEAEGEALRRTLERIEFLVKQGLLSAVDAARKKQEVMDSFCLAPMVDRQRRVRGEEGMMGIGAGRCTTSTDFAYNSGSMSAFPAGAAGAAGAAAAATTASAATAAASTGPAAPAASAIGGCAASGMSAAEMPLVRSTLAEGGDSSEASQSKRRRLPEVR